jgi:hypothetical protein
VAKITPRTRLIRGVLAAVLITSLAVASHETGGGDVGILAALLALMMSALTCVMLAGKMLSPLRSGFAVVVGQGLYHALFAAFPAKPAVGASATALLSQHDHHRPPVPSGVGELISLSSGAQHVESHGGLMWVAHLLAAATALIVVLRGEEAWWQVVHTLSLVIKRLTQSTVVFLGHAAPAGSPASAHLPILTSVRYVVHAPTRRGPPKGLLESLSRL